jgi:hypothetical protein
MTQVIHIGKPAAPTSVRELFQLLAEREAEEIRRLKQAKLRRFRP